MKVSILCRSINCTFFPRDWLRLSVAPGQASFWVSFNISIEINRELCVTDKQLPSYILYMYLHLNAEYHKKDEHNIKKHTIRKISRKLIQKIIDWLMGIYGIYMGIYGNIANFCLNYLCML